jgi:hypothetical protein
MSFVKEDDLYQEFVKHVQDYMFNNTTTCKCIESKIREEANNKKNNKLNHSNGSGFGQTGSGSGSGAENIITPNDNDSLFWCLYIIKNGLTNYTKLTNRSYIIEKQFKIEYIERIRKEKQLLKQHKFDTITNIENKLANENTIDINTFLTLCVIGNLNVFFVKNKTYYELIMNDSNKVYKVEFCSNKKKYGFEETTKDNLDSFRNNYYKLDNMEKPIKSIAYYKTQELIDICGKLGIETIISKDNKEKTKSKKDLYEAIIKCF